MIVAEQQSGDIAKRASAGNDPIFSLRRQVDDLFESFLDDAAFAPFGVRPFSRIPGSGFLTRSGTLMPRMDVEETETDLLVTAEMPGVDEGDIALEIEDNVLSLRAEKRSGYSENKEAGARTERRYGRFERQLALPDGLQTDKATASLDRGVLTIKIPRNAERKPDRRSIPIGD